MAEEILDTLTVVLKSDDSDLKRSTDKVKEWHKEILGIMGKPTKFGMDVSGAKQGIEEVSKMYRSMVQEIKQNTFIPPGIFNGFRDEMELARRAFGIFQRRVNSPLVAKLDTKDFEKSVDQAIRTWETAAVKIQTPLSVPPISINAINSLKTYTDELNRANRAIGRFGRLSGTTGVVGVGGQINITMSEPAHRGNENYAAMLRDELVRDQASARKKREGLGGLGGAFSVMNRRMVGRRTAIEEVSDAFLSKGLSDADILNMRAIEGTVKSAWTVTGNAALRTASMSLRTAGRSIGDRIILPGLGLAIDAVASLTSMAVKTAASAVTIPTYILGKKTGQLITSPYPNTKDLAGKLGALSGIGLGASLGGTGMGMAALSIFSPVLGGLSYLGTAMGFPLSQWGTSLLKLLKTWVENWKGGLAKALSFVTSLSATKLTELWTYIKTLGVMGIIGSPLGIPLLTVAGALTGKYLLPKIGKFLLKSLIGQDEDHQEFHDRKMQTGAYEKTPWTRTMAIGQFLQRAVTGQELFPRNIKPFDLSPYGDKEKAATMTTEGKFAAAVDKFGATTNKYDSMFHKMLDKDWRGGTPPVLTAADVVIPKAEQIETTWAAAKSSMMKSSTDMMAAARALQKAAVDLSSAASSGKTQPITTELAPITRKVTDAESPYMGSAARRTKKGDLSIRESMKSVADYITKEEDRKEKAREQAWRRRNSNKPPGGDNPYSDMPMFTQRWGLGNTKNVPQSMLGAQYTPNTSASNRNFFMMGNKAGDGASTQSSAPQEHFSMMKFLVTQEIMHRMINASRESIKQFVEYDELIARNAARVGGGVSPQLLSKAASGEHSPNDLARAFDTLTRSSFSAKQSMDLLSVSERFATANGIQTSEAARDLSKAFLALDMRSASSGKNLEEMGRLSDLLTKGAGLANTSVSELAEGLSERGAGSIRMMNLNLKDSIAYLLALSEAGFKGGAGSSALSSIYHSIQTSATDNPMGWAKLGVKAFDAKGKMLPLDNILNQFGNRFSGRPDQEVVSRLNELGLDSGRGGIKTLLDMSKNISYFKEQLAEAGGEADRVAQIVGKSLSFQLKSLLTNLQVVAMTVGEIVAPAFKLLGDGLSFVVKWWNGLDSNIRRGVLTMVSLYAAIVPVVFILGSLGTIAASAFRLMLVPLTSLLSGMVSFVWWVGALAVQIAMIPVNIVWTLASAVSAVGSGIISLLANAVMLIPNLLMALPGLLASLIPFGIGLAAIALLIGGLSGPTMQNAIRGMGDSFDGFGDKATGVYERLKADGQDMWESVTGGAHDFVEKGIGFFSNFQENMGILLSWAKENWRGMLTDLLSFVGHLSTNIMHNFEVALPLIGKMLKYYLLDYWIESMPSMLGKALSFIKGFAHDAIMIAGDALTGKDKYREEREASIQSARDGMKLQNANINEEHETIKKAYIAIKDAKENIGQQGALATIRQNEEIIEKSQKRIKGSDESFYFYKDQEKAEMKKLQYYLDTGKLPTADAPTMKTPAELTGKAPFWDLLKDFVPVVDYKGLMSKLNFSIPKDQVLSDNEIIKGGKGSPGLGLMFGGMGAIAPPTPSLKIDKEQYKEISLSRFVLEGPGGLANQDPSGQIVKDPVLHTKMDEQTAAIKALNIPIIGW